ncbi:MAG: hypothetical protein M0Q49_04645 [Porticoccaceae bacterium]|nr:hypothetical protein [Porticoccaceae bacterium]
MTTRGIPEHVAACERAAWKHRIISRDLETAERRWMRALDEWLAANKALSKVMGALDIAEGEMEQLAKGAPRVSALAALTARCRDAVRARLGEIKNAD